jgi:RHS repeat-associated protein
MNNDNHKQTRGGKDEGQKAHLLDRYTVQPKAEGGSEAEDSPFFRSAAPAISLPKGGGALKGIDEKFSVNALNGTAGLEIALPLSPGRGGFTPSLSLSYNSGAGNGPFGLGWNLSLPSIQRKTDKKLPRYQDDIESDVFLLAGAEDLVPKLKEDGEEEEFLSAGATYLIKRYIPRIEGLFARIEYIRKQNTPGGWWRVTTKDNTTTYYGLTAEGRIAAPGHPDNIFQWLPQLTLDHKGNVQLYRYKAENLLNVANHLHERNRLNGTALFTNTYLKRVQYCNRVPWFLEDAQVWEPQLPVAEAFLMEAVLDYGDHAHPWEPLDAADWPARADAFSDFHAGFEIRTYRKCKRVMMFHYFDELTFVEDGVAHKANLVRSLELEYKHNAPDAGLNEADMMVWAWQRGYDYQKRSGIWSWFDKSLPAMHFDYEPLRWDDTVHSVSEKDRTHAPQGLTGPYQWVDFEGEGISGILTEQSGGWFYKSNLGNGHFDTAKSIAHKPSFSGLGQEMQWQDLDADGRRQMVSREVAKGYWELDDDQQWQPFHAFAKDLRINWNSPFTKMLDLDGDGRPDLLVTEDRAWTWYHNEGKNGFGIGGNAPVFTDEEKGPVLLLQDAVQSIFLADMNGDGLTDLVRIKNGEVCYWPNMGYGKFGAKVSMDNAPVFDTPERYNPLYLTLADISGTGAADLIYLGQNNCTAWINLCGNGWSGARHISPLPATNAYSKIAVLDFLGNGTGCLVWSSPLPQHVHAPMRYIDLMGGKKPYLMRQYYNGMGKTVQLTYKSSTQFYLEDKLSGYPWATRLPFPVHCISEVVTKDEVSETAYTQQYKYRHGYYDHEEREFRGFGYVETLDTDKAVWDTLTEEGQEVDITLNQPPVLTRTWNHTGAWMRQKVLTDAFKEEYFRFEEWDEHTLVVDIEHGLKAQELREAHRALKGLPLRQEVYALDGTDKEDIPYTVTASAYAVRLVQPLGENRYASFISYKQQSVAFACERNAADPRVMQELVLEVDEYGNIQKSAQVVYPRKVRPAGLPDRVWEEQQKRHIIFTSNYFTNDVTQSDRHYRLRQAYETRTYECLGLPGSAAALWKAAELYYSINGTPPGMTPVVLPAAAIDFSATASGNKELRLLRHSRTRFKDNNAAGVLDFGMLQSLAIPHEQYTLAATEDVLLQCYGSRVTAAMLDDGGYADLDNDGKYWVPSGTATYQNPGQNFFTPEVFTDPWSVSTTVSFWGNYWLVPEMTADARGNTATVIAYDWRILQPKEMKDANDNLSEVLYDALGMPVAMAVKGKGSEGDSLFNAGLPAPDIYSFGDASAQEHFLEQGDVESARTLLGNATWRCVYRLDSYPATAGMIARTTHVADLAPGAETELLCRFSYTDGLGRIIMHKVPCEPTQCNSYRSWIGTGRTVYNNKGNAVMRYEPYFSYNHLCEAAEDANDEGVSPRLYYDPLSRVYKTEMPDGSYSETLWTAWQQTIYDQNDTVLTSAWYAARMGLPATDPEYQAAQKAAAHAHTPSVMHTDTLARPFYTIQQDSQSSYIHSYVVLDVQGNRLAVVDGKRIGSGLAALTYKYNMLQQPCSRHSIDSGDGYTFTDVAGQPLCAWDADDRKFSMEYDSLRRLKGKRLNDAILLEKTEYKDTADGTGPAMNQRGQLYAHYDSSGKQHMPQGYDFKGNPVTVHQALLQDTTITDVDWDNAHALEAAYTSTSELDALNRPLKMTDPGGNEHFYEYDKGGALKKVWLGSQEYVKDIRYDAKGQRKKIVYGNNTVTRYTYDPLTYRLRTLLTTANTGADKRQELFYTYDPVGNITRIKDGVQPNIYYNNTEVEALQTFTYDALYRLVQATGRELATAGPPDFGTEDSWSDAPAVPSPGSNAARNYTQTYTYDEVGNILSLQHSAGAGSYTRSFTYDAGHNRLVSTSVSAGAIANFTSFPHDARGNMTDMPHLDYLHWNAVNELQELKRGSLQAYYQYSGGQRVRKWVDKGSVKEERVYLGGFEIYRKFDSSSLKIVERTTVHISDDTGRIAMLENRTYGTAAHDNNTLAALTRYIYANHLQSASLELDENADIISYEEYHPYGTSAYQAKSATLNAVAKCYRYTGKERDEESGLYYHGARYYIPWLCRWSAVDPLESKYAGMSPYNYSFNNPVMFNDPSGMKGEEVIYTAQGPEVTITAQDFKEGEQRNKNIPSDAPISLQVHARERFHLGSEGYSRGWYSEGSYVSMNRDVMLGMLHVLLEDAEKGVPRLMSYVHNRSDEGIHKKIDTAALQFLDRNKNTLSPDFFSLLESHGGDLIKGFNLRYSGSGVTYLTDSPIDYVAGGLLKGLGKAAVRGAAAFGAEVEAGVSSMRALSIASTRQFAIAGLESMLKESLAGVKNIWDDIIATQGNYPGSILPKSFELTTASGRVWVHGNATEHIAEFAQMKAVNYTPEAVNLAVQQQLTSLQAAVGKAGKNGFVYGKLMEVGGWELKFGAPRQVGQLPVLFHAMPIH